MASRALGGGLVRRGRACAGEGVGGREEGGAIGGGVAFALCVVEDDFGLCEGGGDGVEGGVDDGEAGLEDRHRLFRRYVRLLMITWRVLIVNTKKD